MTLFPPEEFERRDNFYCCKVCKGSKWDQKITNLTKHRASDKHKQNVSRLRVARPSVRSGDAGAATNLLSKPAVVHRTEDSVLDGDFTNSFDEVYGQDIFSSLKGTLQNAWNDYLEFNDIGLDAAIEAEEMDKDKDEDENDEEEDPASTVQRTNRVLETWLSAPVGKIIDPASLKESKTYLSSDGEWAPYPSKAALLTDVLFNASHLRFSGQQKRALLKWAKDLGARDVPKLSTLENIQKELNTVIGDPTTQKKSRLGNIFYINEIGSGIAKDISNPLLRPHMNFYPEDGKGYMSQLWHGKKWLDDMPDDMVTPMVIHPETAEHYYVGEICQLKNGSYFIPTRWFRRKDEGLWGKGFAVDHTADGFVVSTGGKIERKVDELLRNYTEIIKGSQAPRFASFSQTMPHPIRATAKGMPVYFVPVMIFCDDVSGNVSKQWNKHHVAYASNGSLPRELLDKGCNVRFVGASPNLGPLELLQGIKESFDDASNPGIITYDALLHTECLFRPVPYIWPADNPMQAEECSHSGLTSNKFCRTCHVGGTQEFKRSEEGYLSLFKAGNLRRPEETKNAIFDQFMRAMRPNSRSAVDSLIRDAGIKDTISQPLIDSLVDLSSTLWNKDDQDLTYETLQELLAQELRQLKLLGPIQNPLLDMNGVDIHLDTPTEILHTILLGVVKYFWGQTVHIVVQNKQLHILQSRLESISDDGLNIPRIMASYMCQYRGSLIGKHFKTIVQTLPMVIYDLVHKDLLDAWLILGRLTVLCWHSEIEDIEVFIHELDTVVDELLTKTAICAPSILISKPKFHFLKHLSFYIRRFGPALLFATERYESFNTPFRLSCIHSNRLAPSRDSAHIFANQDRVKHIVCGGWWFDPTSERYRSATPKVISTILEQEDYCHLVGIHKGTRKDPGQVSLVAPNKEEKSHKVKSVPSVPWQQTISSKVPGNGTLYPANCQFLSASSIVVQNLDVAALNSTILVKNEEQGIPYKLGVVEEILMMPGNQYDKPEKLLLLRQYQLEKDRHQLLDMPQLRLTEERFIIKHEDATCVVNVQHDCSRFNCDISGTKHVMQERQTTARTKAIVKHKDSIHFVLNTSSLHNYQHIKCFLASCSPPQSYIEDHEETRKSIAATLREKKLQDKEAKDAAMHTQSSSCGNAAPSVPKAKGKSRVVKNLKVSCDAPTLNMTKPLESMTSMPLQVPQHHAFFSTLSPYPPPIHPTAWEPTSMLSLPTPIPAHQIPYPHHIPQTVFVPPPFPPYPTTLSQSHHEPMSTSWFSPEQYGTGHHPPHPTAGPSSQLWSAGSSYQLPRDGGPNCPELSYTTEATLGPVIPMPLQITGDHIAQTQPMEISSSHRSQIVAHLNAPKKRKRTVKTNIQNKAAKNPKGTDPVKRCHVPQGNIEDAAMREEKLRDEFF